MKLLLAALPLALADSDQPILYSENSIVPWLVPRDEGMGTYNFSHPSSSDLDTLGFWATHNTYLYKYKALALTYQSQLNYAQGVKSWKKSGYKDANNNLMRLDRNFQDTTQEQTTATLQIQLRKWASTEHMIHYVLSDVNMGSQIEFGHFADYGCHCFQGGFEEPVWSTKGHPQDKIDRACFHLKLAYDCARDDGNINDENNPDRLAITWHQGARVTRECLGYHHLIQWHGDIDDQGKPVVHCDDEPGSCGYAICLAERQFALDVKTILSNDVNEYNSQYRKLNGFDRIAQCQGSAAQFDMHATEWLPGQKAEEVQAAGTNAINRPSLHINTVDETTTQNNPTTLEVTTDGSSTPAADVQTPMETSSRTDTSTDVAGSIWDATTDVTTNREVQSADATTQAGNNQATEANTPEIIIATDAPTQAPATDAPTAAPTAPPTAAPTNPPTAAPTAAPTAPPTAAPTNPPSTAAPTTAQTFPEFNDYADDSNGTGDNRATAANNVAPDMIIFNDQSTEPEVVTQANPVITERSTAPNDQGNGDGTAFNVATDAPTAAPTNAPATDAPVVATDAPAAATNAPAATNPPAAPATVPVTNAPATNAPTQAPATNAPAAPVVTNAPAQTPEAARVETAAPATQAPSAAPTAAPTAAPNNQASGATQSNESQQSMDTTTLRLASTGAFSPSTVLNMDADATAADAAAATSTVAQVTQNNANAASDTVVVADPVVTLALEDRHCCGQYPNRFKYNQNSKRCCANTKVYSPLQHVCCENDSTILKDVGATCNSRK